MNTPIVDFVRKYAEKESIRFHMPGHKGVSYLGCEGYDITEIAGADALYEADGIIAESERNAAKLFDSGKTCYSTEGSSQCIRAMLYLAITQQKTGKRPVILAARNVHKSFIYAAALLDIDVQWLWPKEMYSICSCAIEAETLEEMLEVMEEKPAAVYITSPDYLGNQADIAGIAGICHKYGVLLLVDNAHGAYLHFLQEKAHPLDLGADLCCDSAHKTLPVLTGGAYLHAGKQAPAEIKRKMKQAMALFGSTSPSYLILQSLDLCNRYLSENYEERLQKTVRDIRILREQLEGLGWDFEASDPLKLTFRAAEGITGSGLAEILRKHQIECEYADADHCVLMFTPDNTKEEMEKLYDALKDKSVRTAVRRILPVVQTEQRLTIRQAVFAESEYIPAAEAVGRVCAAPTVGCPPAIPIVVSGEVIDENAIHLFAYYGIRQVEVVNICEIPALTGESL